MPTISSIDDTSHSVGNKTPVGPMNRLERKQNYSKQKRPTKVALGQVGKDTTDDIVDN